MNPALLNLIEKFRAAQDRAVAFITGPLRDTLGVRLPVSQSDWIAVCGETGLCFVKKVNGVEVYSHGYGIELTFPDLAIDFDFGDHGEADGFDVWRLHFFSRCNPKLVPLAEHAVVKEWLEEAFAIGEVTRDGLLYYSPAHRAACGQPRGA